MDYFDLLEQNTEDAAVQFQLYEACMNETGDKQEAQQWLQRAAAQGYEPALAVLNAAEDTASAETDYESMPILELMEEAKEDYGAAKMLYRRIAERVDNGRRLELLQGICRFEEATQEDYEICAKATYEAFANQSVTAKEVVNACNNAIEFGSNSAKKMLLNLLASHVRLKAQEAESAFALSKAIAREGDYIDNYCHYIWLFSKAVASIDNLDFYRLGWKETLLQHPEKDSYPRLNAVVADQNRQATVEQLRVYAGKQTAYSRETAAVLLTLCIALPEDIIAVETAERIRLNRYFDDFQFAQYVAAVGASARQKLAEQKARLAAEQQREAEKKRLQEEAERRAQEQQRKAEKARLAEEQRREAEKKRLQEEAERRAQEQRRKAEKEKQMRDRELARRQEAINKQRFAWREKPRECPRCYALSRGKADFCAQCHMDFRKPVVKPFARISTADLDAWLHNNSNKIVIESFECGRFSNDMFENVRIIYRFEDNENTYRIVRMHTNRTLPKPIEVQRKEIRSIAAHPEQYYPQFRKTYYQYATVYTDDCLMIIAEGV